MNIGVPSGVGDTYWCLTKLESFREKNRIKHVTLCIKESPLERATGWLGMVDFVDDVKVVAFDAKLSFLLFGYSERRRNGLDCILWPNAVLDRGTRIEKWLPNYQTNFNFPIKTAPGIEDACVLYISSSRMRKSCFNGMPADYWPNVAKELAETFGTVPVLIGAHFDADFASGIHWQCPIDNRVGKTTLPEVAGILQRARVVVGIISGMTILANHFRVPTVALCPDRYHKAFPRTWIAKGTPYATFWAAKLPNPKNLVLTANSL